MKVRWKGSEIMFARRLRDLRSLVAFEELELELKLATSSSSRIIDSGAADVDAWRSRRGRIRACLFSIGSSRDADFVLEFMVIIGQRAVKGKETVSQLWKGRGKNNDPPEDEDRCL